VAGVSVPAARADGARVDPASPDGSSARDRPVQAVLDELAAGAPTTAEVARRTGLDAEVVSAVITHLVRTGRVAARTLVAGCPDGGCGSCPQSSGPDGSGCAAGATSAEEPSGTGATATSVGRRGPVLVALRVRR